jgi:hypothetical protein
MRPSNNPPDATRIATDLTPPSSRPSEEVGEQVAYSPVVPPFRSDPAREACAGSDLDRKIDGCTRIIEGRNEAERDRTFAYFERGVAYARKGELETAPSSPNHIGYRAVARR